MQSKALEDDLEQFRQRWRDEVSATVEPSAAADGQPASSALEKAVDLYMNGMRLEQQGLMYEATQQYRRAMQTDPDVEQAIRRLLVTRHGTRRQRADGGTETDSDTNESDGSESTRDERREEGTELRCDEHDVLDRLRVFALDDSTDGSFCQPEALHAGAHISCLPAELMQLVVRWVVSADVDVRSLEMLGLVCRGMYRLTRDPALWKRICRRVLGAAACADVGAATDWRQMYMTRPHLLFSGCYVSRASYIRGGDSTGYQDASYRPWHMVHYYRYLRLFPDGVLLMLTSADEPALSVGRLLHRPPHRGATIAGHWRLKRNVLFAVLHKPRDPTAHRGRPCRVRQRDKKPYDAGEQWLHVEFEITPWRAGTCQLVWQSYNIVTRYRSGREASHVVPLGDQFPPLSFSRVRSYTASSEAPLD